MLKRLIFFIGKMVFKVLPLPSGLRDRAIEKAVDYYTIASGWMGKNPSLVIEKVEAESPYDGLSLPTAQDERYIPYEEKVPFAVCPAKVIAFYLPQFHTIPENDEWWGEGFTEWTNVKPAQPQFEGHYQPRVPGELGYYNVLDQKTQIRQVELAKNYGLGGFCFHFYWFGGKRLLEQPILDYLANPGLDFPFCLSWANENWSRRWDGRESDVLIQQNHSPEDDIAFIQYVSVYLDDPRYIQISGKPLLIVYRPGILPDARETVLRWRSWYRTHKGRELYIACTHSFETVDPKIYDMDAALEFPPNNSNARLIDHEVRPLTLNFQSILYDWRSLVLRSMPYAATDYTLFRGVCPSWDNTARRKNKGAVFLHSSPGLYQKWLKNALEDTLQRIGNTDEQLVFVNAWNEWAEGAYLEPDARYGYAYLEATWSALNQVGTRPDQELLANKT